MTVRTLEAKYEAKDDSTSHVRRVFCASKDQREIYCHFEDEREAASESDASAEASSPTLARVAAPQPVVDATPSVAAAGPAH